MLPPNVENNVGGVQLLPGVMAQICSIHHWRLDLRLRAERCIQIWTHLYLRSESLRSRHLESRVCTTSEILRVKGGIFPLWVTLAPLLDR